MENDLRYFEIHKSHQDTVLIFLNISAFQYYFFITSVSCFVFFFCWIFENNYPEGGVLAGIFCPRGRGVALSLCPRSGNSSFQKIPPDLPGGMVRLGID